MNNTMRNDDASCPVREWHQHKTRACELLKHNSRMRARLFFFVSEPKWPCAGPPGSGSSAVLSRWTMMMRACFLSFLYPLVAVVTRMVVLLLLLSMTGVSLALDPVPAPANNANQVWFPSDDSNFDKNLQSAEFAIVAFCLCRVLLLTDG